MKKTTSLLIFLLTFSYFASSQLKVLSVEKLSIPESEQWSNPTFSPDGNALFLTTPPYTGIWKYDLGKKTLLEITRDPASGFGFSVSPNGEQIVYRRTRETTDGMKRMQEIVAVNLVDKSSRIVESGPDLSEPHFSGNGIVYSVGSELQNQSRPLQTGAVSVLGIENTKIALLKNGGKVLFDPFGNGGYIWPSLSPDKKNILAYEADRGTFICDLDGSILTKFGRRDAPVWTRDGKWIVYMDDRDDGHVILSSTIKAVSVDGKVTVDLTTNGARIDLHPNCSMVENKIVFNTMRGEIFMLSFEEVQ